MEGGTSTALDLLRVPQLPKGLRETHPSLHSKPALSLISLGDFTVPLWALMVASEYEDRAGSPKAL